MHGGEAPLLQFVAGRRCSAGSPHHSPLACIEPITTIEIAKSGWRMRLANFSAAFDRFPWASATWAAWVEVVTEWFIGLTSGMWGCAAHGAISGMKWAGANLPESFGNLGGFDLMTRQTHALIVVAGARLQPGRACARPHERNI